MSRVTNQAAKKRSADVTARIMSRTHEVESAEETIAKAVSEAHARASAKPESPIKVHANVVKKTVEAERAASGTLEKKIRKTKSTEPLYREALDKKKATKNHRGPGTVITDEQLAEYIAGVKKDRPTSSPNVELEIAYWIKGYQLGRSRWMKVWNAEPKAKLTTARPVIAKRHVEPIPKKTTPRKVAAARQAS